MTLTKKEINELWEKAKTGKYYDNDEIKANKGSIKGLKSYDFNGNILNNK